MVLLLLLSVKQYFRVLGIHPPDDPRSSLLNAKNIFAYLLMVIATLQVAVYGLNGSHSATEYGLCFYVFCTTLIQSFHVIFNALKIKKIYRLIEHFERFINKRSNDQALAKVYRELNQTAERICKVIYVMLIKITLPALLLPIFCISSVNYLIRDMKEDSFYLPIPVAFPFNWKTPLGYSTALLIESTIAFYLCSYSVSTVCCFFGSSWTLASIIGEIATDFRSLNPYERSEEHLMKLQNHLCQLIQNIAEAKQLTTEFNKLYSVDITDAFLWSLATISSGLFVLESELSNGVGINIELITPLTFVFWSVTWVAFFCELGQMVTNQFEILYGEIWLCEWYTFPMKMQRMLIPIMANTQYPTIIHGYGGAFCSREAVKQTINKGFSYFMFLYRLT